MESLSQDVSVDFKHRKIYALLDLLMGCNRNHMSTSTVLEPENSFMSLMEDAVLDSALVVDSHAVSNPLEEEKANVPKEHIEDSLPKFRPPRKGMSAIRSFPPGCGRGATRVRIQGHSRGLQNDSSSNKRKQCHGAPSNMTDKPTSISGPDSCKPRLQPGIPRKYFKRLEPLGDKGKMAGIRERSTGIKISGGCNNVKSGQGKLAAGIEPTVKRNVVQALMASSHCPWRGVKRMSESQSR